MRLKVISSLLYVKKLARLMPHYKLPSVVRRQFVWDPVAGKEILARNNRTWQILDAVDYEFQNGMQYGRF